jgi:hypothetical protein
VSRIFEEAVEDKELEVRFLLQKALPFLFLLAGLVKSFCWPSKIKLTLISSPNYFLVAIGLHG